MLKVPFRQEIRELVIHGIDLPRGQTMLHTHNERAPDKSNGMIPPIKGGDLLGCCFLGRTDFKQTEIFRTDKVPGEQLVFYKGEPLVPVIATGVLQANDGLRVRLACLGQSEDFKPLIVGTKAAWEQSDGVGLLDEHQLSGEEVLEVDQLGVIGNDFIGPLFKRQHDIHAEALLSSCAFLSGSHDAIGSPRDNHVPSFDDSAGKSKRQLVIGVRWLCPG